MHTCCAGIIWDPISGMGVGETKYAPSAQKSVVGGNVPPNIPTVPSPVGPYDFRTLAKLKMVAHCKSDPPSYCSFQMPWIIVWC